MTYSNDLTKEQVQDKLKLSNRYLTLMRDKYKSNKCNEGINKRYQKARKIYDHYAAMHRRMIDPTVAADVLKKAFNQA